MLPFHKITFLVLALSGSLLAEKTNCPHEDDSLVNWDVAGSWPKGVVPVDGDELIITKPILLNTKTANLKGVVLKDGGRLVFSPNAENVKLSSNYVLIQNGSSLEIGSATCSFDKRADIELIGMRNDEFINEKFGQKFIGVDEGGVLEIHGQQRQAWSKLTSTLKATPKTFVRQRGEGRTYGWPDYYEIHEFSPEGEFRQSKSNVRTVPDIEAMLKSTQADSIIVMSKYSGNRVHSAHCEVKELLDSTFGINSILNTLDSYEQAWLMMIDRSDPSNLVEKVGIVTDTGDIKGYQTEKAELEIGDYRLNAKVYSYYTSPETEIRTGIKDIEIETYHIGIFESTIELEHDVSDWRTGDIIFVASTDYDFQQAEQFDIVAVSGKSVTFKGQVMYTHFGEIYEGVDMRAEVGLLTRDIKIYGKMEESCYLSDENNCEDFDNKDTFGGHTKAIKGFTSYNIEGVELFNMGQATVLGSYPIHFHLCEDTDTVQAPIVKNNAIHDTFSRCVTIHGSHGVQITDNVAFNHFGHCYFLEDGGEKRTYLKNNLGAGTKKGVLTLSDANPSTFWITSPLTTMIDNVAAGAHNEKGVGIWFLFPDEPVGPSKAYNFFEKREAKHTPITEFTNNVAHSNGLTGFSFNRRLGENHEIIGCSTYNPRADPKNSRSALSPITLNGFTGYKNINQNVIMRSSGADLNNFKLADSLVGIRLDRNQFDGYQRISNAIIIGESNNMGNGGTVRIQTESGSWKYVDNERTIPKNWAPSEEIIGIEINAQGPTHFENIAFFGFKRNDLREAIAIMWRDDFAQINGVKSSAQGLSFDFEDPSQGLKMLNPMDKTGRGEATIMITDIDGTLTGKPQSITAISDAYFLNEAENCVDSPKWNMKTCDDPNLARILVSPREPEMLSSFVTDESGTNKLQVTNEDGLFPTYTINAGASHILHFGEFPAGKNIDVRVQALDQNEQVIIGICVPYVVANETTYKQAVWRPEGIVLADSISSLRTDADKNTYFDEEMGIIYAKFLETNVRSDDNLSECAKGNSLADCPRFQVKLNNFKDVIDVTQGSDCTTRLSR